MGQIIKPESLHLQAYSILKQSILDGERKPSERVVEAKVAGTLGISRGPVREAIRMLIQDGLLEYNDGFVKVYEPTVKDIIEIFQCRESLEILAIKQAIEHSNETLLEDLKKNIKETEQALDKGALLKQFDQQFHTIIINASKNNHLIQLLEMIKTKIHYMRNNMIDAPFYPTLLDEHEKIYQSIVGKNVEKATELVSIHIQRGLDGVLEHIN
ncbi:GntR family transcriptional regulator [Pseudogracilibacillus auburnensis]|uniref:GntR family transcriptional regulator n=1 Tax=Pseudogracilibacillus auburnensis TaxID=1494959 RepID=A0A2V3VF48_9BACI|nr:GntR family transcriptional regulator [Pseudogracilibacillus auburnensis]MBO1002494.1 GntR family transcriptional regulator [Pseudogracilibacillus auburnensis]PXW80446.1 GntR family transcriptional regulator [Pseudogracilibacillus auburnensis]